MQTSTDVTINGRTFQIKALSAKSGSWVAFQMGSKGFKDLDFETHSKILDMLFSQCSVYVESNDGTKIPMKLYEAGRWLAAPEMERDLDSIMKLHRAALDFNLNPISSTSENSETAEIPDTIQ